MNWDESYDKEVDFWYCENGYKTLILGRVTKVTPETITIKFLNRETVYNRSQITLNR